MVITDGCPTNVGHLELLNDNVRGSGDKVWQANVYRTLRTYVYLYGHVLKILEKGVYLEIPLSKISLSKM